METTRDGPGTRDTTTTTTLQLGEVVETTDGRRLTVTEKALGCVPRVREHLAALARDGATTTYGALVRDLELPYPAVGVGRVLDLVEVDRARRGEPALDGVLRRSGRSASTDRTSSPR